MVPYLDFLSNLAGLKRESVTGQDCVKLRELLMNTHCRD